MSVVSLGITAWLRLRGACCACTLLLALGTLARCTEAVQVGENLVSVDPPDPPDASLPEDESSLPTLAIGGASDGGRGAPDASAGRCLEVTCGGLQACGNCRDDDQDGLVD